MTVAELIKALQALPQEATVVVVDRNCETPPMGPTLATAVGQYKHLPTVTWEYDGSGGLIFPGLNPGDPIVVL